MNEKAILPDWASRSQDDGIVYIDPDKAFPHYFKLLGLTEMSAYNVSIARRCAIKDLVDIYGFGVFKIIDKHSKVSDPDALGNCHKINTNPWGFNNLPGGEKEWNRGSNDFMGHYQKLTNARSKELLLRNG